MYEKFFAFKERPFQLVPNPAYLFLSRTHEEVLAHLTYAVSQGDGFVEITGEVGTGKTTLCRVFLGNLGELTEAAYIFNPMTDAVQLLKTVNDEFGIDSGPDTVKSLLDILNRFLMDKYKQGRQVILLIDEAQNLNKDVLEQIRLLSNLETETRKLIQIILVGQPELRETLDSYELRQLAQRITLSCHLTPLSMLETYDYIDHRIRIASNKPGVKFTKAAVRNVYNYSGGTPRLVNIACDRALLTAYGLGKRKVSGSVAKSAIRELAARGDLRKFAHRENHQTPIMLLVICLLLFLGIFYFNAMTGSPPPPSPPAENRQAGSKVRIAPLVNAPEDGTGNVPPATKKEQVPAAAPGAIEEKREAGQQAGPEVAALSKNEEIGQGEEEKAVPPIETPVEEPEKSSEILLADTSGKTESPGMQAPGTKPEGMDEETPVTSGDTSTEQPAVEKEPEKMSAEGHDAVTAETAASAGKAGEAAGDAQTEKTPADAQGDAQIEKTPADAPGDKIEKMPVKPVPLKALTEEQMIGKTRQAAIHQAMSLWQPQVMVPESLHGIEDDSTFFRMAARQNAFSIYQLKKTQIDLLIKLNIPAVIPLRVQGRLIYLTLARIENGQMVFQKDSLQMTASRDELARNWSGLAYLPWKNFYGLAGIIPRDASKETMMTLKMILKDIGFRQLPLDSRYDDATRDAVKLLQEHHGQTPDGAVGPLTKIILYNEVAMLAIPHLQPASPLFSRQ